MDNESLSVMAVQLEHRLQNFVQPQVGIAVLARRVEGVGLKSQICSCPGSDGKIRLRFTSSDVLNATFGPVF